jgi:hypothetical protein
MVVPKPVYGSVDGPVHYPDHPFPMLQQRIIAGIRKFHWVSITSFKSIIPQIIG